MIHATTCRLLAVFLVLLALDAAAHPGRTAADGCHFCRSNCDRWNVEADKRHCHGGSAGSSEREAPAASCPAGSGERWRGLVVAPECRCTPYDRDDYPYPQSVEARIADRLGGMFSPYDGTTFSRTSASPTSST